MYIGDDIHTTKTTVNGQEQLTFNENNGDGHDHAHSGTSEIATEEHIFVTALNFKLIDLW
jgi:hypothetical protein